MQTDCCDSSDLSPSKHPRSVGQHLNSSMFSKWNILQMHPILCGVSGRVALCFVRAWGSQADLSMQAAYNSNSDAQWLLGKVGAHLEGDEGAARVQLGLQMDLAWDTSVLSCCPSEGGVGQRPPSYSISSLLGAAEGCSSVAKPKHTAGDNPAFCKP